MTTEIQYTAEGERTAVLAAAKDVGLIAWISDDGDHFTFSDCEVMSDKLVALWRRASKAQPKGTDWTTPTTYRDRFADAVARLCGRRAPEDMVDAWLTPGSEDTRLQEFAIEHGPAWAQGIVLLDAAAVMAETPTEGVEQHSRALLAANKQAIEGAR